MFHWIGTLLVFSGTLVFVDVFRLGQQGLQIYKDYDSMDKNYEDTSVNTTDAKAKSE